jgi:HD-GYP domain-containing protein (c-di-GMP phosphodiesterase class II)
MRRITVKYAKEGMVVEQPVYDCWGNMLLDKNQELKAATIDEMKKRDVTEIFIRDERIKDCMVTPLFSPRTEGALAKSFRWLVQDNSSKQTLSDGHLSHVQATIIDMVKEMSASHAGDVNVSCSISAKDYVYLQPVKTAALSMAISNTLKRPGAELVAIGMAAVLKDICLPVDIINSADSLAEGDSLRMRDHPSKAHKMLSRHRMTIGPIATIVQQHHEQWSGKGFPLQLKGKEITALARIISIADAFVDLLSDRPGRNRYMSHEAIEYIMAGGGDQFDPELVEVFSRRIPSYPSGLSVQLNNGDTGIVINPKLGFIARPIVRICSKADQGELKTPVDIDLSKVEYQRNLITKVLEYD